MLGNSGFDLWADGYDKSVGLSDENGSYPFAGYRQILNEVYNRVLSGNGKNILDIGFGTGTLTAKLYEMGCSVRGQDFSEKMIELAKQKMPEAEFYQGDFSEGLTDALQQNRYDAIIAAWSLHHLTDAQKIRLIKSLLPLLSENGCIYIADVAFKNRAEMKMQRDQIGEDWDEDEIYFAADEMKEAFPEIEFESFSFCCGLFSLRKPS